MHGNVWEWCEDDWHDNYDEAPIDGRAWKGEGEAVCRGGSWLSNGWGLRSAYRNNWQTAKRNDNIGFRLARAHTAVGWRSRTRQHPASRLQYNESK